MTIDPPPIVDNVVKDDKKVSLPWALFFQQLQIGDLGTVWTPTFQSLTEVGGAATIAGRFYQINANLVFFRIDITPVTNTSAVAGTTYCDNFPPQVNANGVCLSVSGNLGGAIGVVRSSDGRIYVPAWTTVTNTVTILGMVEAT